MLSRKSFESWRVDNGVLGVLFVLGMQEREQAQGSWDSCDRTAKSWERRFVFLEFGLTLLCPCASVCYTCLVIVIEPFETSKGMNIFIISQSSSDR